MKAEELRIGNYVIVNNETDIVSKVILIGIETVIVDFKKGIMSLPVTNVIPIELTEDWLIRFGFLKEIRGGFNSNLYYKNGFLVELHKSLTSDDFAYGERKPNGETLWIDSVHQLQNLYYALSGEELILNEK